MEAALGARTLSEVEVMSLEDLLRDLRTAANPPVSRIKQTRIPLLDTVVGQHFQATQAPGLTISGRYLPALYKLTSTLIAAPHHYAVLVIDLEDRFDPTRLLASHSCEPGDLDHLYIQRPARCSPEQVRGIVAGAEDFMLYSPAARASQDRRFWGTIVIGGTGAGDVTAGWKGWLRVDRDHVPTFLPGVSAEEALEKREMRQKLVDAAGWKAASPWGGFVFHEEAEFINSSGHGNK